MTYCEGKNCDRKETCERHVNTAYPSGIEQIVDFSTCGCGTANASEVNVSPYCGIGSMYDYFIPHGFSNVIINKPKSLNDYTTITPLKIEEKEEIIDKKLREDKPVLIKIPEKYVSKIPDWGYGINSDNIGEFSDGYHTFNELYHHRAILFAVICNQFKNLAWKSKLHSDETMYDDMFIVGINTPQGPATYHYNIEPYWDLFDCKEIPKAPEWDGHTPDDAIKRIYSLVEDDKPLTTLEMINTANKNHFTYECINLRYSLEKGFHDKNGKPWSGEAFSTLNEFMNLKTWKVLYKES